MSRVDYIYLIFLIVFHFEEVFSERRLMVNLYSEKENKLLKNVRLKRSTDIESYCSTNGCCDSRNDDCNLFYSGKNAICYCDTFCDRTPWGHVDCCPDFWMTCIGENLKESSTTNAPSTVFRGTSDTKGCFKDGSYYQDKSILRYNCNYCYCYENYWRCTDHACLVEPELINYINEGDFGWTADNYSQFWGMTLSEGFEYRLGTKPLSPSLLSMNEMAHLVSQDEEFPLFFIASYKWPDYIHRPLDQKNCAASWAFSTASVAADRVAIHSQGQHTSNLSPQDLISCNVHNQYGCRGGHIDGAWWFLRKRGLVSHECSPFEMNDDTNRYNTCNISIITDNYGKSHTTDPCPNRLEDSNYLYQCSPPYRIPSNEREIMKEIMENGPVQGPPKRTCSLCLRRRNISVEDLSRICGPTRYSQLFLASGRGIFCLNSKYAVMTVNEDFFLYKSGIYKNTGVFQKKPGTNGTHSVKIVGWGALQSPSIEKFWIVANSWGNTWGENGYFRITRGENECGIESFIIGAWCYTM